jgi:hypothetical protein
MIGRTLILLLLIFPGLLPGQDFLNRSVALQVHDMPLKDVLDQISEYSGVYFTYAGNLPVLEKRISLNIDKVPLNKLLNDLFFGEEVVFSFYSNQVILKKKPEAVKNFPVRGVVLAMGTEQPVEFTSLQFKISKRGTVAGIDGKFEITTNITELSDSISFYCIGFEPRTLSVKSLTSMEHHTIFLTPRLVELNPVELSAKKAETIREGNKGVAMGSLYLDTHGQQVALFLENRKKKSGRLKTISFFLSGKGNTEAPFRIRIYGVNDTVISPGLEILPDILVVKPLSGRGWFEVDVSRYNIRFPECGIFVAMEGIYPGDYVQFLQSAGGGDGSLAGNDDFIEGSLEYGQRLGYNRFTKNETWHYSLSHTWFQLDKKLFNVMISADILVYDQKNTKKQKL